MKRVEPAFYNIQYFKDRYHDIGYKELKKTSDFDHIYQESGSFLNLSKEDKVVDLGCGTGQFSFYLFLRYGCYATGIDYSPDAIEICQTNIREMEKKPRFKNIGEKIKFVLADNENLPNFQDIKAFYLLDVIEHLSDDEIDLVLEKIKRTVNPNGVYLIIRTDNNNYLRFVLPITNFISVILGKTTYTRIRNEKEIVMRGHINLTTSGKLIKKLKQKDFEIIKLEYPEINLDIIKDQIGLIGRYKLILYPIYLFGRLLFFLRPSFYLLAKFEK